MKPRAPLQSDVRLVMALCPAIAVSDTLATAVAIGVVIVLAWCTSALCASTFAKLPDSAATSLRLLVVATLIGCISLLMDAVLHELRGALGIFLPLVAGSFALLWSPSTSIKMTQRLADAARHGATAFVALAILGTAREIVGRGSLLHDAAWTGLPRLELFPSDLGFLLAVLPPGAFIAFGLLLAAYNWLLSRHRHESDENR